jgi:serine protease Do
MTQTAVFCTWRRSIVSTALGLCCTLFCGFTQAEEKVSLRHTRTVLAIQRAEPAVVNIEGNKPAAGARSTDGPQVNGMGAGVIIDPRGYILTNQHVVQDVTRIEVTLNDGTKHVGRLIARDGATDLALVKIDVKKVLPVIPCGTSSDLMRGEPVIAIGNPFGYHHTVTEGIISALHRDIPVNGAQEYPDLIQTDASINPGNSGGPLLNAEGSMIGINAAVRIGAQGIGFAIPVDRAIEVAAELIAQHRTNIFETPIHVKTEFQAGKSQLKVVTGSGPKLQRGDVIVGVAETAVTTRLAYELALIGYTHGDEIPIHVERAGEQFDATIAIGRPGNSSRVQLASSNSSVQEQLYRSLGLRLEPADSAKVRTVDATYKGGLKVVSVRSNSPADKAQISPGDILVGLMEWQTPNWDDLAWILKSNEFASSRSYKFHIMRGKEVFWGTMEAGSVR